MKPLRISIKNILFLLLVWIIAIIIVNPLGEFPLNDDWAYSKNLYHLCEEGKLILSDWPAQTLIAQTLIGTLVCKLFGFSFGVLRILTLVFSAASVYLFYQIIKMITPDNKIALFVSFLFMFNPIYFSLSFTFMTEIYYFFFFLLSLFFFFRNLESDRIIYIGLGTLFSVVATLTRQTGIIIPFSFGLIWFYKNPKSVKNILISIFPFIITIGSYYFYSYYLKITDKIPYNYGQPDSLIHSLLYPDLNQFISHLGYILFYAGFFLLPLTICYLPAISFPDSKKKLIIFIIFEVVIISGFQKVWTTIPWGNILFNLGLGPKLLKDTYWGDNINPALPDWFWYGLEILIIIEISLILMKLVGQINSLKLNSGKNNSSPVKLMKSIFLIILTGYLIYLLLNKNFIDRYSLPVTICLLILFIPEKISFPVRRFVVPISLLLIFSFFSIFSTHDYLSWNRARWKAVDYLLNEKNISPYKIDGGFEVNAWYEAGPFNPHQKNGISWWFVTEDEYVLSFGPVSGYNFLKSFHYQRYLSFGKDSVRIIHHPLEGARPYSIYPVVCDCELLSDNPFYLLSAKDSVEFKGGLQRSSEHVHSGEYSLMLSSDNPFGFECRFKEVKPGERFIASVWRYGEGNSSALVINSVIGGKYSELSENVIEKDSLGWDLLQLEITIPEDIQFNMIGAFVWNINGTDAWFDDFTVTRLPAK
ncbi:MAG: hypothetical protein AMS27_06225 [Bacteroides sp. SM23_62_1]|nr:MAG: hypothetical protein AMS27_06225 [Bacteroides sp. SM23_62_1]